MDSRCELPRLARDPAFSRTDLFFDETVPVGEPVDDRPVRRVMVRCHPRELAFLRVCRIRLRQDFSNASISSAVKVFDVRTVRNSK